MKYMNIVLTGIFAIMLINTLNLNVITSANAELSGFDLNGVVNALNSISGSLRSIASAIGSK